MNDSLALPLHFRDLICLGANYRLPLSIAHVLDPARLQALEEADPAGRESVTGLGLQALRYDEITDRADPRVSSDIALSSSL